MFAVVFIPDFSLQAVLRHEPEQRARPVALLDPALPKTGIIQLTAPARACGVVEGLATSQALARCSDLVIKPRSLVQEQAATDVLLQTAYAFSPNIEATAPGVCTMELKGLGLDTAMAMQSRAGRILRALAGLDLDARLGVAVTPALALLAAHAARPLLVVRNSIDFVSALPVDALEPGPDIRSILERWGVRTVGALAALGKTDLAERLGPEIVALLDRISPAAVRPLKLVVPAEKFEEQMDFEQEIETAEPLLFVLRRFVEQLARRVDAIHLVVAELHLRLGLSSGAIYERPFKIPAPTGSEETLFRMLQTHLETVRTDAPITSLCLAARPCRPEQHQFGLFETTLKDPNQFAETLAHLAGLCGPNRVGTPVVEGTHRPDVFRVEMPDWHGGSRSECDPNHASGGFPSAPARFPGEREICHPPSVGPGDTCFSDAPFQAVPNAGRKSDAIRASSPRRVPSALSQGEAPCGGNSCGPSLRRFRPALTAVIEFRDQRPVWLHSSVFNGALAGARGPFVGSGDWWDRNQWSREEWDAPAADGAIYRICRTHEGCFVEGIYD